MRKHCYNSRCAENEDNYCSEDFMVVLGTTWITCKDYIKIKPEVETPTIKTDSRQVKNPILELEIES